MSWVNWDKKETGKPKVILEDVSAFGNNNLCGHGNNKDSCYFCLTRTEPKKEEDSNSFGESGMFKNV
jgi:hypothetical protein